MEDYNRHLEKIKRVEQSHEWEWFGKCRLDGGNFVGTFSKKCEICGRQEETGGGCFVATACYGNYDATEVLTLRAYRDERLLSNWLGTAFVKFYYFVSPHLVQPIEKSDKAKNFIRKYLLSPLVRRINQKLNKEE